VAVVGFADGLNHGWRGAEGIDVGAEINHLQRVEAKSPQFGTLHASVFGPHGVASQSY
jgi:hypothetical protein